MIAICSQFPGIITGLCSLAVSTAVLTGDTNRDKERKSAPEITTDTLVSQATDYDEVIITTSPHS